jgi:membrane-bound metal-dependent hydrolase YbcI (DUF457 family)
MFIGHYGVSFAMKRVEPRLPLGALFLAVQGIDILWAVFILTGIEKARMIPHFLPASPLDLYYMPYTHSLVGALFWSLVVYRVTPALARSPSTARMGLLLGAAVFSHWLLDLVVHTRDLPLYDNTIKMGFGLWNYRALTFFLELAVLGAGAALYLRGSRPPHRTRLIVLIAVLFVLHLYNLFAPPPPNIQVMAVSAETAYWALAALAWWADRHTSPA